MTQHPVRRIVHRVLGQTRLRWAGLALAVVVSVGASLAPPQILRWILDRFLQTGVTAGLLGAALLYFAGFALGDGADVMKGVLLTDLGQRIVQELRLAMLEKLERLPAEYFTQNPVGAVTSVFLNDVDAISELFSEGLVSMGVDCLKILGIVASIWLFSPALGVFVLALVPLIFCITGFFRRRMLRAQTENLRDLSRLNRHIAESMANRVTIQSLRKEQYLEGQYAQCLAQNYATCSRVNFYDACFSPVIQVLTAGAVAVLLTLSTHGNLGITVGMAAASVNLITSLFAPIDSLGTELQSIQKGLSGVKSAAAFLNLEETSGDERPVDADGWRTDGADICFSGVSFAYAGGAPVLRDLTLHIPAHSSCCFVGRTGVGKSTCFKLVTGLLAPAQGALQVGGTAAAAIPNRQKRRIFGYVEQSFSFVRGDVIRQVTLGDPEITEEMADAALKAVGLLEEVQALPQGTHTDVSDGGCFSQGQRQLLGIARAIAAQPPILLLDEITASLDSVTEQQVQQVLRRVGGEKTVLAITHRTENLESYDQLVLLENERIRDMGTPEAVLERNPWLRGSA